MSLKIALLGDICLNGKFDLEINPRAQEYFREVAQYLEKFDFVIANLETPLTDRIFTLTCKGLHLKSSKISVELLTYLHVNVVGLANNHIFDYGSGGYKDTIEVLEKNNIHFYGTEGKQVYLEDDSNKVVIGGYCCFSTNPSVCNSSGVNALDPESIVDILLANDKKGYLNLVSIHWGDENIHYPRLDHIRTARFLASKVPLIIHGHHPHVIQGIEQYKSSWFAYSLGNFCTDDVISTVVKDLKVTQERVNKESFIMVLEIEKNILIQHEIMPIFDNGTKLELGITEIRDAISEYSTSLKISPFEYMKFRNKKMVDLDILKFKKKNIFWYLNRMNYYFIGAVLKSIFVSRKRYIKAFRFIKGEY